MYSDDPVESVNSAIKINNEIDEIKNRAYFNVPEELAADRYVNMFKLVKLDCFYIP